MVGRVFALALLAILSALAAPALAAPEAVVAEGTLRGHAVGRAEVFEGIPYAAAPVGALRWAPPVASLPWKGTRDASKPGSSCAQPGPAGGRGANVPSENEDCLFLNVWRPKGTQPGAKLPVIMWFHGGGMVYGAGDMFRAERLVSEGRPVIVVTINYRLGIFGFFAHPGLDQEHPVVGSGNYGILDQQFALRWIAANAAAFGGDPKNVTIAGESGGAQSVCVQLASPFAKGLFRQAISQSGPCQYQFPSLADSQEVGRSTAERLGCTGTDKAIVACLRRIPVAAMLTNMVPGAGGPGNGPSVGGGVLPLNIRESVAFGRSNQVPVLQGSNQDESLWHVASRYADPAVPLTASGYSEALRRSFGPRASAVEAAYPPSAFASPLAALARVLTDSSVNYRIGACNTLLAHRLLAPSRKLYAYELADPRAPFPFAPYEFATGGIHGSGHTSELAYLWDSPAQLTPGQQRLSRMMIAYWTNFAANGDPNGPGLPEWRPFEPDAERVQTLSPDRVRESRMFGQEHKCDFWARMGLNTLYSFEYRADYKAVNIR